MDQKRRKLNPEKKLAMVEESIGNMTSETCDFDYLALKNEGNALYTAGDFLGAVHKYSKSLILCTDKNMDRSTLLKNRAAAYLNLRKYQKVIQDTTTALEIIPSDIKALYRRCQAYEQLGKYNEAFEDARAVNRLNPQNRAILPYLRRLQEIVNESNDDALSINSLPNEIILKIFGYLKQNQLGRIARVCRTWNVLTKSGVLWKNVNVRLFPTRQPITFKLKSFINRLPSCATSISLDLVKHEDWLSLDFGEFCRKLHQKVPQLEELILNKSDPSDTLSSIIDLCTELLQNLKILALQNCVFPDNSEGEELSCTSKIEVLDLSLSNFSCSSKPQFSRMPCLKALSLRHTFLDDTCFEDDISFLKQLHVLDLGGTSITFNTFWVIQEHGHNLKELYLCFTNLQDHDLAFNKSVFPHLKTICLFRTWVTCEGVVSLIQSWPSLENVYADEDVAESFTAHPFVVANRLKAGIVKAIDMIHKHYVNYSHT